MPNICYNKLTIRGERSEIEHFLEQVDGPDTLFDFEKIIPVPKELDEVQSVERVQKDIYLLCREAIEGDLTEEEIKGLDRKIFDSDVTYRENAKKAFHCVVKYGASDWYDWCVEHWGTKWNAFDTSIKWRKNFYKKACCYLSFSTAWTPPSPLIEEIKIRFPKLTFRLEAQVENPKPDENSIILGNGEFLNVQRLDGKPLTEEEKETIKKTYIEGGGLNQR